MPRDERRVGRYGLLLLATVTSVAIQGIAEPGPVQQVLVTATAGGTLVLAFRGARLAPRLMRAVTIFAAAAIVVAIVRATAGGIGEGGALAGDAPPAALRPPPVAIRPYPGVRAPP